MHRFSRSALVSLFSLVLAISACSDSGKKDEDVGSLARKLNQCNIGNPCNIQTLDIDGNPTPSYCFTGGKGSPVLVCDFTKPAAGFPASFQTPGCFDKVDAFGVSAYCDDVETPELMHCTNPKTNQALMCDDPSHTLVPETGTGGSGGSAGSAGAGGTGGSGDPCEGVQPLTSCSTWGQCAHCGNLRCDAGTWVPEDSVDCSGGAGAAGSAGSAGSSGSAGDAGTAGSAGDSGTGGSGGDAGTAGDAGSAGDSGSAGSAGDAGTAGDAGSAGDAGAAGSSAGTAGSAGDAGTAGSAGDSGSSGSSGSAGDAGSAGTAGDAGSAGSAGSAAGTGGSGGDAGTGGAGGSAPMCPPMGGIIECKSGNPCWTENEVCVAWQGNAPVLLYCTDCWQGDKPYGYLLKESETCDDIQPWCTYDGSGGASGSAGSAGSSAGSSGSSGSSGSAGSAAGTAGAAGSAGAAMQQLTIIWQPPSTYAPQNDLAAPAWVESADPELVGTTSMVPYGTLATLSKNGAFYSAAINFLKGEMVSSANVKFFSTACSDDNSVAPGWHGDTCTSRCGGDYLGPVQGKKMGKVFVYNGPTLLPVTYSNDDHDALPCTMWFGFQVPS